ncbi:MAG: leucine-rich repeat protein, partial [Clostridia bacterium]|nr:leucine-rich repeat protein [Clostridia bacterium]
MLRKVIIALLAVFLVFLFEGALAATLTLPESLETIEASAFEGDRSLDEVVLPEGIVSIRSRAFADSSVTAINLPVSLQEIADDAFDDASAVRIQAVTGSEQYAWAVEHGYLLAFDDPEAYDFHAQRAAFEDNESIGLYHEAWIRNYQIDHYDELAGHRTGEPEWSVAIEGNSYGAQVSYAIGEWAGEGSQAIDVSISNEPTTSCTISVRVTCAWGGETISGVCTLEYVRTSL